MPMTALRSRSKFAILSELLFEEFARVKPPNMESSENMAQIASTRPTPIPPVDCLAAIAGMFSSGSEELSPNFSRVVSSSLPCGTTSLSREMNQPRFPLIGSTTIVTLPSVEKNCVWMNLSWSDKKMPKFG